MEVNNEICNQLIIGTILLKSGNNIVDIDNCHFNNSASKAKGGI